jgi:hypothetical protein
MPYSPAAAEARAGRGMENWIKQHLPTLAEVEREVVTNSGTELRLLSEALAGLQLAVGKALRRKGRGKPACAAEIARIYPLLVSWGMADLTKSLRAQVGVSNRTIRRWVARGK